MGTLPAVLSKSITISRGDGIPPNSAQNLDILRRVGTLLAVLSTFIKYQVAATLFLPNEVKTYIKSAECEYFQYVASNLTSGKIFDFSGSIYIILDRTALCLTNVWRCDII